MRRLLVAVLLVATVATPASAALPSAPNAPQAGLSATSTGRLDWQLSKVVFSDWGGEEYDNSFPPVEWPKAMRTRGTQLIVTISTAEMPERVELRMWKELRRNGIPRGKRNDMQCYFNAPPGECALRPTVSGDDVAWNIEFQPPWRGRIYLATAAKWPDAQVAWINHAILK
jgi:hypothetical protein